MEEIKLLIQKSHRFLTSAKLLLAEEDVESACSRAYYTMFYAAQALLLHKGVSPKTHKGVRTEFAKHYIHTNIFPVTMVKDFSFVADMRSAGDYEIYVTITSEEAKESIDSAINFLSSTEEYINLHYPNLYSA